MFWRTGKRVSEVREDAAPQGLNSKVQTEAQKIDRYFDSLLYPDMPMEQAVWVEQQRAAAHAELTRQTMAAALDGWQRPGRMR